MRRWLAVVALGAALGPAAAAAKAEEAPGKKVVAVLAFSANSAAEEQAQAVGALVAAEVAQASAELEVITEADVAALLGAEREKRLLGAQCDGTVCAAEISGAVGARYLLNGRVDRFGEAYVLTATLFDAEGQGVLAKLQADAEDEGALPRASRELADGAVRALQGSARPVAATASGAAGGRGEIGLGLKVGNAFLANVAEFNLSGDLELGWRFEPEWVAFVQVGFSLIRPREEIFPEQFVLLPSVVGVRHLYGVSNRLQPFWGLGLGVQLALGDRFGIFRNTGPLPTVLGFAGLQYRVSRHVVLGIEGTTNLAQATLGLTGSGLGDGFNLDLNGSVGWVF